MTAFTTELLESGVQVITLDMADETMNVLREELIEDFNTVFTEAGQNPDVTGIIFRSGKDSFIAGADIAMIDNAITAQDVAALSKALQDTTILIEKLSKPTAAVIHGCLLYTSPSPRDQRGSRMPSSA